MHETFVKSGVALNWIKRDFSLNVWISFLMMNKNLQQKIIQCLGLRIPAITKENLNCREGQPEYTYNSHYVETSIFIKRVLYY